MTINANYHPQNRMYATNPIGVATTLPQADMTSQMTSHMIDNDRAHAIHDGFLLRDGNTGSEVNILEEKNTVWLKLSLIVSLAVACVFVSILNTL